MPTSEEAYVEADALIERCRLSKAWRTEVAQAFQAAVDAATEAAEKRADDAAKENGFQRDTIVALRAENERYTDYVKRAGDALASEREALAASQALVRSLREALLDAWYTVTCAPKGSIGAIGNTYLAQIGVEQAERWRAALAEAPPPLRFHCDHGVSVAVKCPQCAAQVAPEPEAPAGCVINEVLSRVCSRGTKSCEVFNHGTGE